MIQTITVSLSDSEHSHCIRQQNNNKKNVLKISENRTRQSKQLSNTDAQDRVTHQDNDLGFGQAGVEQLSDGQDSSSDLLCRVLVIVGSNPQHDHLVGATHSFCLLPKTTQLTLATQQDAAAFDVHTDQLTRPKTGGSFKLAASERTPVRVYHSVHH